MKSGKTLKYSSAIVLMLILFTAFNSPNPVAETPYVITATDQNFESITKKGVVIVDFWATWCGPCRRQSPILVELATEMKGKIIVAKLDVDKNRSTSNRFAVRSIPTLIVFKNGKAVKRLVGLNSKEALKTHLKDIVK